jgi:hypothetical protein
MSKSRASDKKIGLSKEDKAFQLNKITYLEFKHLEPERTLLYLFPRLKFDGNLGKIRNSSMIMTIQKFQEFFLDEDLEHHFQNFSAYPDIVYKWLETDLLDLINRGHPVKEAVVAPRPLHGNAYKYRNAKQARDYDSSKQLYWMLFYARQGLGQKARDDLRNYIFAGLDANTDKLDFTNPVTQSQIDVETQAILHLDNQADVAAKSETSKSVDRFEPLCIGQADLLAEDILRLLTYEKHMPRSVLIDYLKTLFSFHLGLYHLRLLKLLPALVKRQGNDPTCQRCPMAPSQKAPHGDCAHRIGLLVDMGDSGNAAMAELARRSTEIHYQRITPYLHAHFTVVKINEMADYLSRLGKLPADIVTSSVGELLQLTQKGYEKQRDSFFGTRLQQLVERFLYDPEDAVVPQEIQDILDLKLDSMESYIEILMSQRSQYHRQQLIKCLDSLLQKNNSSGLLQQPNRGPRRFVLGSRLLEVLLQLAVLERQGSRFSTREIRIDELLEFLRERYGLYIDRLPPIDGFGEATIQDQQALRANLETFKTRLREIGFFQDLSDAYITQTVTPRYTINI